MSYPLRGSGSLGITSATSRGFTWAFRPNGWSSLAGSPAGPPGGSPVGSPVGRPSRGAGPANVREPGLILSTPRQSPAITGNVDLFTFPIQLRATQSCR